MWGEPAVAEPGVTCNSLRHAVRSPGEVFPVSWDSGSGSWEGRCG